MLKVWKLSCGIFVFAIVTFAWIFFRADTLTDAFILISALKTFGMPPFLGNGINQFGHCIIAIFLLFGIEYCMEFKPNLSLFNHQYKAVRWVSILTLIFIIMIFGVFNGGQFIYFQF